MNKLSSSYTYYKLYSKRVHEDLIKALELEIRWLKQALFFVVIGFVLLFLLYK